MDQCQTTGRALITGLITAVALCTAAAQAYRPTIQLLPRLSMELTMEAPEV